MLLYMLFLSMSANFPVLHPSRCVHKNYAMHVYRMFGIGQAIPRNGSCNRTAQQVCRAFAEKSPFPRKCTNEELYISRRDRALVVRIHCDLVTYAVWPGYAQTSDVELPALTTENP